MEKLYFHHQKEMKSLMKTLRNMTIVFFCFLAALLIAVLLYIAFTNSNPITNDHNELTGFIAIGALVLSAILLYAIAESKDPATYIFLLTVVIVVGFVAEIIPGLIATIVTVVMIVAPKYLGKSTSEELIMTEDNITYRSKEIKVLNWSEISVIYFNHQFIQFIGKRTLTFPFEQEIIENIKQLVIMNQLPINIVDNYGSNLITNDFYALAFNESYYINGVNIFDSYPANIKNKRDVNIVVVHSNLQKVESHVFETVEVKGNTCIFNIGIIKYLPNQYALFLTNSDRKKVASQKYSVQTDRKTNLSNKIKLIIDLECDKIKANQHVVFSEDGMYCSRVEKKNTLYLIQKEQLMFLEDNGLFSDQFYAWEPLGKIFTETELEAAKITANKVLNKHSNLKAKTYQILTNNRTNKKEFAPKEFFLTQFELILSDFSINFEELYFGLNKLKFEELYKKLVNAENEKISEIISNFFKSFSEKELGYSHENLDDNFMQEFAEYIIEFIV